MKKTINHKKTIRQAAFLFITLIFYQLLFAQTQSIITASTVIPSQLAGTQLTNYNNLTSSELNDSFKLVVVQNLSTSQVDGKLKLALSTLPCTDMIFTAVTVNYTSENDYYWYGIIASDVDAPCQGGSLVLMAKNGEKFGSVTFDDYSYDLQDLGSGLQSLSRYKLDSMDENGCQLGAVDTGNVRHASPTTSLPPSTSTTTPIVKPPLNTIPSGRYVPCQQDCGVKVLVLWTAAAASAESNINNRIALSLALTNQTYLNSDVGTGLHLVLAGSQQISFTETSSIDNDVTTLKNSSTVQALRAAAQADIVVLLTKGNYRNSTTIYLGKAAGLGPNFANSYAIVQTNSATSGKQTFAHETGHLFGCQHISGSDGTYAHAFDFRTGVIFTRHRFTTMATSPRNRPNELYYSNPDVSFKNKATGNATHNNARRLRDVGCSLANLYVNPPLNTMSVNIIQDNPNVCCKNVTAEAEVICGTAPFYYNWLISYDGINWTLLPNSEIVNFNTLCDKTVLSIQLAVTDAYGEFAQITRYYNADCSQEMRGIKKPVLTTDPILNNTKAPMVKVKPTTGTSGAIVKRIFPNPSSSNIQAELNIVNAMNLRIDIIDGSGNVKQQVLNAMLPKGSRILTLNTAEFPSGVYQLRVTAKDKTEYHRFVIAH